MHQRMNPHEAAPDLRKPMYALTQHIAANIDPTLFELIKLYASMLNGCAHCVDIHSTDALKAGESTARLFGLLGWYETPFYTPRERAALALTEAATKFGPHGVPEDEVLDSVLLARTRLRRLVEPEEVADAVAFLCSPAATSMTGSSLVLDGGWSAA